METLSVTWASVMLAPKLMCRLNVPLFLWLSVLKNVIWLWRWIAQVKGRWRCRCYRENKKCGILSGHHSLKGVVECCVEGKGRCKGAMLSFFAIVQDSQCWTPVCVASGVEQTVLVNTHIPFGWQFLNPFSFFIFPQQSNFSKFSSLSGSIHWAVYYISLSLSSCLLVSLITQNFGSLLTLHFNKNILDDILYLSIYQSCILHTVYLEEVGDFVFEPTYIPNLQKLSLPNSVLHP